MLTGDGHLVLIGVRAPYQGVHVDLGAVQDAHAVGSEVLGSASLGVARDELGKTRR